MQMKIARRSWIIFLFLLVSCGSLKISKHTDLAGPSELGQADADNDSVPDLLDKCPRSIPGETIGRDGCPAPSVHPTLLEWNMLTFESGSSELTQESKSRLNDVIEFLNRTLTRIEIVGHSDACGSQIVNRALSLKRTNVARNYLVASGLNPTQIVRIIGAGSDEPIDMRLPESACESKINRRVVFEEIK